MTAADLAALPDSGRRYELVRGELHEMPPPRYRHGATVGRVCVALTTYVEAHQLGEVLCGDTGFLLERDPDTVRAPDVSFMHIDRIPKGPERDRYLDTPPDLAVEVLSPDDRPGPIAAKVHAYLRAGVRMVWLVDPRGGDVQVFTAEGPPRTYGPIDEVDGDPVLPGFRCPGRDLLA